MSTIAPKKKLLCLLLSFALLVSMTPLAYADEINNHVEQIPESTLQEENEGLDSETKDLQEETGDDIDEDVTEDNDSDLEESDLEQEDLDDEPESVPTVIEDERAGVDYVEGEIIVVFKTETSAEEATEVIERNDTVDEEAFTEESIIDEEAVVAEVAEGVTVAEAVEELTQDPEVDYAQPNYLYYTTEIEGEEGSVETQATVTINDEYYVRGYQWSLGAAKLPNAWGLAQTNRKVGVAVIDTGVNTNHPDLKNNIAPGSYFDATHAFNSAESKQTGDTNGHGTHVAGIVAAETNNGIGVSGSSYNAQIVPICIRDYKGRMNTAYLSAAFDYLFSSAGNGKTIAQKYNVKVINMSLGGTYPDSTLRTKIDEAQKKGILTVASSGNVETDPKYYTPQGSVLYPAAFSSCMSVGNLEQRGSSVAISDYSIANAYVDIAAPGTGILSTLNTGGYGYMSGTSMASPFVAGSAALLFASNTSATPASVRSALINTATDKGAKGRDNYFGNGAINTYAAVLALSKTTINYPQTINPNQLDPIQCSVSSSITSATTWKWSIVEGRATINSSGLITPTGVGDITVKAEYTKDSKLSATVTIKRPDVEISLSKSSYTYSGAECKPQVSSVKYNGSVIPQSQYTVSYLNNINAGDNASVKVVLSTGVYKGTYTKKFTINPLNISKSTSMASVSSQAYKGAAIKPTPAVKFGATTLKNGTDYSYSYKNNTNPGTATVTATFKGNYSGSISKTFNITGASLTYTTHVQSYGWIGSSPSNKLAQNGQMSGTSGKSLRVEALQINLVNNTMYPGGISYKTQIQGIGWQSARSAYSAGNSTKEVKGGISGTSGKSLRLETLSIELTGQLKDHYDIYYRVHAEGVGWMGWAKNGQDAAGTVGLSLRLEAIQVYLVPKTMSGPGATFKGVSTVSPNYPCAVDTSSAGLKGDVKYNAMLHIQSIGNKNYSSVNGSTMLGTSGRSLRLEALKMSLVNPKYSGSINYEVHVQGIGDQGYRSANGLAGTSGRALRLEALRIKLTGTMATKYDIYYRTHVQGIGWTGWAKNGQWSGSAGYSYRMEAMEIVIVDKGTTAPGLNQSYYYKR